PCHAAAPPPRGGGGELASTMSVGGGGGALFSPTIKNYPHPRAGSPPPALPPPQNGGCRVVLTLRPGWSCWSRATPAGAILVPPMHTARRFGRPAMGSTTAPVMSLSWR